jgi:predicted DNA-binding helix-hairpin-helix protein
MKVWKERRINGLFLSSSVERDPDDAVERELEAVRMLRSSGFSAYVHMKLMPGCSPELVKQSVELADRVGINVEFPKSEYYNEMKIHLDFRQDIVKRLKFLSRQIKKAQREGKCRAGLDSQMVVGAVDENDKDILKMSEWMYNKLKARRVYYSSFEPITRTPLENRQPSSKWREYRLYQCSFLIQRYGFRTKEFVLEGDMLPNVDQKILFAKQSNIRVDVNDASFNELIKVPGIGLETARRIMEQRDVTKIRNEKDLKNVGVIVKRALPFIKLNSSFQTRLSHFS